MLRTRDDLTVRGVLESSTLLNALTNEDMMALAQHSKLVDVGRGETIWLQGDQPDFFGVGGLGFIKMARSTSPGIESTLEIMGPGQVFGMLSSIEGIGMPLSAYGLTNATYVKVPKSVFMPIYEASHLLKDRLIRRTSTRMHQKLDFMSRLSSGKAEERIAAILFILAETYGEPIERKIRIQIPLTRQEIGEMAGTTTETTIRVLSKWNKEGIVSTDQHIVTLLQVSKLEALL